MRSLSVMVFLLLFIAGCKKKNARTPSEETETTQNHLLTTKSAQIGNSSIHIPAGTSYYFSKDKSTVYFELPPGYSFFAPDDGQSTVIDSEPLPVSPIGKYKCVCSGGGTCTVFYQEDIGGFGCVHNSCTGSCTGSFSTTKEKQITGILNMDNEDVSARNDQTFIPASFQEGKLADFFEQPIVQQKIAEQYAFIYKKVKVPDFNTFQAKRDGSGYKFIKSRLYGVTFYLLAPDAISELSREISVIDADKASCACTAGSSGTCTLKTKGILGYKAYWCEGSCNGCELTIN